MSDKLFPLSIKKLLAQILTELEKSNSIFGIYRSLFYQPHNEDIFTTSIFGQELETPLGVAAGPHTQLAQNIVSAWLCGARYIELKTIQTLDDIEVSKPCIDMQEEGYNCEWSQELKVEQSYREYLKAWIIIHILKDKFDWLNDRGAIFNMSIGYDMEGIQKENVQWFLRKMADCGREKAEMVSSIRDLYPNIDEIAIPDKISNNVTLSTMHGCPSGEIEEIGKYLLSEKKLHTFIKLNPTLLGKERVRSILNKKLGYQTPIPELAFEHDIEYSEARDIILSLQETAKKENLFFGLKLTNTLEAENHRDIFDEDSMYLSGKALHPISINLAHRIRDDEKLQNIPISFAGGVDNTNVSRVMGCGLHPITVCSDLLRPGGYGKLSQYLEKLEKNFSDYQSSRIEDYIKNKSGESNPGIAAAKNLKQYAVETINDPEYQPVDRNIKMERELTEFDCIKAPCVSQCPSSQNIPEYMYHTSRGQFDQALQTILQDNPFPRVTGMVCDHVCQTKCTRINYDRALLIRGVKRTIAEEAKRQEHEQAANVSARVAIIGAGPSGLAAAYYLIKAGLEVKVFEAKKFPGGMLADAIPDFRLNQEALQADIKAIQKMGADIETNYPIDKDRFEEIKENYNYVYVAVGAQKSKKIRIKGDNVEQGLLEPLEFLLKVHKGNKVDISNNVVVLGGGNTAIDVARTINFLQNPRGQVRIVYRRTKKEMPADPDEIQAALAEGIDLIELTAPVEIISSNGKVKGIICSKMRLGEPDESGRPRPVEITGSKFKIQADTIIPAFGQTPDIDFIDKEKLEVKNSESGELVMSDVFIGGDALRGASSIIKGIADGKRVAREILDKLGHQPEFAKVDKGLKHQEYHEKRARIKKGEKHKEIPISQRDFEHLIEIPLTPGEAEKEARRCLFCDDLCDICVTVCPNRANYSYTVEPFEIKLQKVLIRNGSAQIIDGKKFGVNQQYQVLNIADLCNECGNCTTFCPTSGRPFKDKPTVHLSQTSFDQGDGYYLENGILHHRIGDALFRLHLKDQFYLFESDDFAIKLDRKNFSIIEANSKKDSRQEISLEPAVKMSIIADAIRGLFHGFIIEPLKEEV